MLKHLIMRGHILSTHPLVMHLWTGMMPLEGCSHTTYVMCRSKEMNKYNEAYLIECLKKP